MATIKSLEEKAKAYDEALKRAKIWQEHLYDVNDKDYADELNYIFPELKESEDERIRKHLIGVVELYYGKTDEQEKKDCLAWLENQGEKRSGCSLMEAWKDMRFEAYAQASGNRHESNYCDNTTKMFSLNDIDEIIEKLGEKFVEQSPAWSEEDEKILSDIIKDLVHPWNEYIPDRREDEIKWLKNKLKSLRPQSHWKPSDEHYELEEFAKIVRGNLTGISKAVQKLFEAKYLQLTGNKMYGGFKD